MTNYASDFSTKKTSQSQAIPGKSQVKNSAGGFVFEVDDFTRLDRFLILGNDGGSYYASQKQLTIENAECVVRCLKEDAIRTVDRIVEVSVEKRAPKNDPAIFALALCASPQFNKDESGGVKYALSKLNDVCRTGTHLFQFAENIKHLRGWGRGLRKAIASWYTDKDAGALAYQVTKYQQRNGWSHKDLLRLSHPKATGLLNSVLDYVINGDKLLTLHQIDTISGVQQAKNAKSPKEIVRLINEYHLVRECIPTEFLNDASVWEALLENMPAMAMVRNLGKMTAVGLIKPMSQASQLVKTRLMNSQFIKDSGIHPLSILMAGSVYRNGHGVKGSLSWNPDSNVNYGLDQAFSLAFSGIVPTGKRHLLAIDVSASMTWSNIAGTFIEPREGAAAMAAVTVRTEDLTHTVAFSAEYGSSGFNGPRQGIKAFDVNKGSSVQDVMNATSRMPAVSTDCALPMLYASDNKIEADVFVVYTDSETWAGNIHPCQALKDYRQKMGIDAKLIVVGMISNGFSIADPDDAGMMDVVGFDSSAPAIMADFVR